MLPYIYENNALWQWGFSPFERMIFLKKKTIKMVASTMVFAFGLSVVPIPAFAVSTNVVADTEGKNTLTVSEIQELAVLYNDTVDTLELKRKQIELQEQMTRNQRRKVNNQIQSLGDTDMSAGSSSLDNVSGIISSESSSDNEKTLAGAVYGILYSSQMSTAQTLDSTFDQLLDGREQLDDALEQLADGKNDLEKSMKDLEQIMRYTSAQLALSIVQLTDSVELMEKQLTLLDKSIAIYELQESLGMVTTLDVDSQRTSKVEAENQLRSTKEQLDSLKRSLNILIGRAADTPLEIVPMELSGVINPAPTFTQELVHEFVEVNPKMETLLDERQDLKDSVKSSMGSDEKQEIEYQIQAKTQELKTQRQTAEDDLKAMIATIEKNAVTYRVGKEKLEAEQKNYAIAQKKYELGMISQLQLLQNELTLRQAELTNLSNGYQHYFDWQKYYLAKQGIDVSSLV